MGNNKVELSAKAGMEKVFSDLEKLNETVRRVQSELKQTNTEITEATQGNVKKTQDFLTKMKNMGHSVATQLKSDFKSLFGINAIQDALKLSNQFRGVISESVTLNGTIRKLGTTFRIAQGDYAAFQSRVTKGMGDLGLASDVAARTMEGLAESPVRGQEALLEYSKTAGQLASISKTKGQEGNIAKGISDVIQAKGGNVESIDEMKAVAEDLRRVYSVTGKAPAETLSAMKQIFSTMPKEVRKAISTRGLANLAATSSVAGPGSTKFLEEFLGKSSIQRKALEEQGFKDVFTEKGLDLDKFGKAASEVLARVGGDPRVAAKTIGLSDEAAEGFIRLAESLDKVKAAQDLVNSSSGDLTEQFRRSRSLSEAFSANIDKIKSTLAKPVSTVINGLTEGLSKASETTAGAAAVTVGGGVLAALLAGGGLRGLAGGLGGLAKAEAIEKVTGEEVQKVYVVNASEISGGGLAAMAGAGGGESRLGKLLKGAGGVMAAGTAGYAIGEAIQENVIQKKTIGTTKEGFEGNIIERLFFKMDKLFGGQGASNIQKANQAMTRNKVEVDLKSKELKVVKASRGVTY